MRAGGLGLLGACDLAIASGGHVAFTEVRIGVAPAVISLPLLPRTRTTPCARYSSRVNVSTRRRRIRQGLLTATGDNVDITLEPVLDGLRRASQGLAEQKRLLTARVLEAFDRDADALTALGRTVLLPRRPARG